jgi:hypothetical protein
MRPWPCLWPLSLSQVIHSYFVVNFVTGAIKLKLREIKTWHVALLPQPQSNEHFMLAFFIKASGEQRQRKSHEIFTLTV